MPKWSGAVAAALIEREGATFTTAAAVFLHDLLAVYRAGAHSAHRLTHFMSGGAPTPPAMVREAHSLGVFAFRGYGMTETGGGVCWGGPNESLDVCAETDGRVVPGSQIQAVDVDRRPVPHGEEGEIRVRGPQNMIGYTDPEQTAATVDEDNWIYTGDLGTVTVDGLIRITGRTKDIINRGGEKFSAREIEELILSHPSIQDAAVVGLDDPRLGEKVGAFVTLKPDQAWVGDDALAVYLREARLALQKIPTEWVVLDALPRTASGKIQKHVLRSLEAHHAPRP
jgi:acyl-CoA synthetase (AMP-forming)/AMP-acid ligase II